MATRLPHLSDATPMGTWPGPPIAGPRHLLGVLDLGFGGLDAMMRTVAALREAPGRPLGHLVGTHVALAERHVRCGVRDALARVGCRGVEASWDELAASVARAALLGDRPGPALLVGVDPDDRRLAEVAAHVDVPVLSAGTNRHQPLVVLADLVTLHDFLGPLVGRRVLLTEPDPAFRRSWAEACVLARMRCAVTPSTSRDTLGPELADAVAAAALFGAEVVPAPARPTGDVDVVVGPAPTGLDTDGDVVVLPGRVDAEDAGPGRAGSDASRAVLFHRSRSLVVTTAALVSLLAGPAASAT